MIHRLQVELQLTTGQFEVLKTIAALKGVSVREFLHSAIIDNLGAEVDHNFKSGNKMRDESFAKLGFQWGARIW